jgi:hypothetical protein
MKTFDGIRFFHGYRQACQNANQISGLDDVELIGSW